MLLISLIVACTQQDKIVEECPDNTFDAVVVVEPEDAAEEIEEPEEYKECHKTLEIRPHARPEHSCNDHEGNLSHRDNTLPPERPPPVPTVEQSITKSDAFLVKAPAIGKQDQISE